MVKSRVLVVHAPENGPIGADFPLLERRPPREPLRTIQCKRSLPAGTVHLAYHLQSGLSHRVAAPGLRCGHALPTDWKRITHRDLYPANIFRHWPAATAAGRWNESLSQIVVGDFGLSAHEDDAWWRIANFDSEHTPTAFLDMVPLSQVVEEMSIVGCDCGTDYLAGDEAWEDTFPMGRYSARCETRYSVSCRGRTRTTTRCRTLTVV